MLSKIVSRLVSGGLFVLIIAGIFAAVSGEAGPAAIPQQPATLLQIDVVTRDRDLLHITSNWPESFSVQNVSKKVVNGFTITIMTAETEGGPGEVVGWGRQPQKDPAKNHHLKPLEIVTVPIQPKQVEAFIKHGSPFLYVQLAQVWYDDNPDEAMSYGATTVRDKDNPEQFNVIINSKGRDPKTGKVLDPNVGSTHTHFNEKKPERNHAKPRAAVPHMKHSNQPPASLIVCCSHEFYNWAYLDCIADDPCQPTG